MERQHTKPKADSPNQEYLPKREQGGVAKWLGRCPIKTGEGGMISQKCASPLMHASTLRGQTNAITINQSNSPRMTN